MSPSGCCQPPARGQAGLGSSGRQARAPPITPSICGGDGAWVTTNGSRQVHEQLREAGGGAAQRALKLQREVHEAHRFTAASVQQPAARTSAVGQQAQPSKHGTRTHQHQPQPTCISSPFRASLGASSPPLAASSCKRRAGANSCASTSACANSTCSIWCGFESERQ